MVPVVVGLTVMEPLAVGFSVSSSAVDGYHDFWRVAAGSGAFLVVVQSVIVASRFGAVGMVLSVVVLPACCYMYK